MFIQESEGSEGESEYDDGTNNGEDELISDGGEEQEAVCDGVGTSGKAHLIWYYVFQGLSGSQMSPGKLLRVQQTVPRQQKKQKRKAEEGKLHAKRQEMDKAKVHGLPSPFSRFSTINEFSDCRCGQAVLGFTRSNGVI
jgi:SWI/SNF-related matrix-associated actin-dependent regulator of chromatin subfamily A member 5